MVLRCTRGSSAIMFSLGLVIKYFKLFVFYHYHGNCSQHIISTPLGYINYIGAVEFTFFSQGLVFFF